MSSVAAEDALFRADEACRHAGGRLVGAEGRSIRGVVVDSRQVEEGFLFVALPGQRVDGHDFIPEALRRGAAALMASTSRWRERGQQFDELLQSAPAVSVILLEDTLAGLQRLAKAYLRRFPRLRRIGVTGSNGKTTTKEALGSIVALDRPTVISEGNLNSEIGLPLSCFRVRKDHRAAVFELGINHPGEMGVLADIYRPDVALITNIGTAHIGLLGSREAIALEKRKIFSHFDGSQKAFVFEAEEFLNLLKEGLKGKLIPFGPQSTRGFEGSEDLGLEGTIIHWEGLRIRFPLFGAHNLRNALASISVSEEMGVSKEKIKEGLESVRPLFGRSQIIRDRVTTIQDCYNANPESFHQVFHFVSQLPWPGRKIAVLGSMKELGDRSREAHRRVGDRAAGADFQALFLFGEEMEAAFAEIKNGDYQGMVKWMTDFESLREELHSYLRDGDLLLIKGSRAVELERLLPAVAGG
jgi:UDP-N-acetylmuramoyl-tripeptide--D-alanyl-D-alanine ligase